MRSDEWTELGSTRALDTETGGEWEGGASHWITEMTADSRFNRFDRKDLIGWLRSWNNLIGLPQRSTSQLIRGEWGELCEWMRRTKSSWLNFITWRITWSSRAMIVIQFVLIFYEWWITPGSGITESFLYVVWLSIHANSIRLVECTVNNDILFV